MFLPSTNLQQNHNHICKTLGKSQWGLDLENHILYSFRQYFVID